MALEPKDKELVAIGASLGAGCAPCIGHHIPAGRDAGLTDAGLVRAVEVAEAVHQLAVEMLARRTQELLGVTEKSADVPLQTSVTSWSDELVALGTSIGANCHPLLEQYVARVLKEGARASQVRSAIKMAEFVQQHAGEVTTEKAAAAFEAAQPKATTAPQDQ